MRIVQASFLALCLAAASCAPPEVRFCDRKCACEGCSEREFDRCVDNLDDRFYDADEERCLPEYDAYVSCQNATGFCDRSGDYETDCGPERRDLDECVD